MGVPAFFKWLTQTYPDVVTPLLSRVAKAEKEEAKEQQPLNEFDHLYLDMNGIIHQCTHPDRQNQSATTTARAEFKSEDAMLAAICDYVDKIVNVIQPRRLLYLAIDGVAPRAKMNQQRARRFRAAQDALIRTEAENQVRREWAAQNRAVPPAASASASWDSNVITPGTQFMMRVAHALRQHIARRLSDGSWGRHLQVILSDAQVAGEGEHKIMRFIRLQRMQPGYDRMTRHCFYGKDADLILLGLATHEQHCAVLREVEPEMNVKDAKDAKDSRDGKDGKDTKRPNPTVSEHDFQLVRLDVLRKQLQNAICPGDPLATFRFDGERVIDDFVFLCIFVGNDFLPHLPLLEVREGAVALLLDLYRKKLPLLGGYLTDAGRVHLARVSLFLSEVGALESRIAERKATSHHNRPRATDGFAQPVASHSKDAFAEAVDKRFEELTMALISRSSSTKTSSKQEAQHDAIPLGHRGWKRDYYARKFGIDVMDRAHQTYAEQVLRAYGEGLCWVTAYYYQDCPSWKWFYPFHYSPPASDLCSLDGLCRADSMFYSPGAPWPPLAQLMAVLPPASAHCLPPAYARLMTRPDSNIVDFYPEQFALDLNGKRFGWQAVVLLPFIDEERLLGAIASVQDTLTTEEKRRNLPGGDLLFARADHSTAALVRLASKEWVPLSGPLIGSIQRTSEEHTFVQVECVTFANPAYCLAPTKAIAASSAPIQVRPEPRRSSQRYHRHQHQHRTPRAFAHFF